ncbi:MAG: hypothetical protein WCJ26_01795 [bacterium]
MKCINPRKLNLSFGLIIFGCVMLTSNGFTQSLKVNIRVNSTVGMRPSIPFEDMPENKTKTLTKGESLQNRSVSGMGAFTITGKENTDMLIRLDAPQVLVNKENQTMPYQMKLALVNNTSADVNSLNWSSNKSNVFKLSKSLNEVQHKNLRDDDFQASLYLKGTADVSANSKSTFEGKVKLTIEY